MPELPEVETIRRQLEPLIAGRSVVAAGGHPSPKFRPAADATGSVITGVGRRGKYLMVQLAGSRELVVHLGMTGVLALRPVDDAPGPHRRAWWALAGRDDERGRRRLLELSDIRQFGRVAVVPTGDYSALPTLAQLGPEPLGPGFTGDGLAAALHRSRARVKTQLLAQRAVAGVGNIYADEALWLAAINPAARRVGPARAETLRRAIVEVLTAGVANGGTRLRDYRTMDGDTGGHQRHLSCYGRAGRPCLRCGDELRRRVIDGRGTTWCPTCQRR